jgi:4-diphosphocytidyl-2-C-methyl-D-erythritol kinase
MDEDTDRPATIVRSALAKINLALHVTGRLANTYHELDTVAVFADCGERVVVEEAEGLRLQIEGPFSASVPHDETNLALAAARLFFSSVSFDDKALLSLHKTIPIGAGLGGGSADAAATFHALNQYFKSGFDEQALAGLGARLGADIPMCVHSCALRARGIGEVIEPLSILPPLPLVLVWPGKPVSTAAVFSRLKNLTNDPLSDLPESLPTIEDVVAYLAETRNDLQAAALEIEPAIADALGALRDSDKCLLARMSGSGSACFGLYPSKAEADAAERAMHANRPDWWIRAVWAA